MELGSSSLHSRKTQKFDVSGDCSVHQLKDELLSQSPGNSLLPVGVTTGNYDLSPDQQGSAQSNSPNSVVLGSNLDFGRISDVESLGNRAKGKGVSIESESSELGNSSGDNMDVDCGWDCKGSYELCFLKKVLCEDIGTDFDDNKLVFLAVHAVFLESGFVGFDPVSRMQIDFFDMLKEQSLMSFPLTVSYTLPDLLSSDNVTESIVLTFETLKDHVNVNGSLSSSMEKMHKLSIHDGVFVSAIGHFRANADIHGRLDEKDPTKAYAERVILEFWKSAKDELALHLMIDLCEKTGLSLPPCLMRLPGDLKYHILELLSGRDTARVACVCKELSTLSSNDELWKGKYMFEYDSRLRDIDDGNWKAWFAFEGVRARQREKYLAKKLEAGVDDCTCMCGRQPCGSNVVKKQRFAYWEGLGAFSTDGGD